jgi:hypothetical protein
MSNNLNIPERVPNHLLDLEKICQDHVYSREIDEKSFSDIAFKMLQGVDTKEVAGFITGLKGELEVAYRRYNALREQVNGFLWSATRDTLPWPSAFTEMGSLLTGEPKKLLTLLAELESADGACRLADQYKDARALVGKAIIDAKKLVTELIPKYNKV